ncbi:helix-turn-helix domain-containing protein [Streptomyces sp. NPDC092296]|uniref:helix-turn-helix domain-containing protein n=1 Tax=Streptomyces sp. NPDC092296 TaxID=3366012 RepID=UPI00382DD021
MTTAAEPPAAQSAADAARNRLATELRSAYENGARVKDLAVVSHRAQSEVRKLLREAGAVLGGGARRPTRALIPATVPATRHRRPAETGSPWGGPGPLRGVVLGTPQPPPAGARPEPSTPQQPAQAPAQPPTAERRRMAARVVRVGTDTCFAVIDEWRPAIAVPVPTRVLAAVTGLDRWRLLGTRLTVLAYPGALHDHDLAAEDWQPARPPHPGS